MTILATLLQDIERIIRNRKAEGLPPIPNRGYTFVSSGTTWKVHNFIDGSHLPATIHLTHDDFATGAEVSVFLRISKLL